jgi:hypothetical protein
MTSARRVFAKLRQLAPYALIELLLPGGTLLALGLWLYRRRKVRLAAAQTEQMRKASARDVKGSGCVGMNSCDTKPLKPQSAMAAAIAW